MESFQNPGRVRATYRLQFHERFRLSDALALVPYLSELGISHIYASPLTRSAAHSTHGYDVCDPRQLNPEIGTEDELAKLIVALRDHKMGLVLDIVPNHMAASTENPWWNDLLLHGRNSPYAGYFDIEWESTTPQKNGKLLLPVLGGPYQEMLEAGQIKLQAENGAHVICYAGLKFPIAPGSLSDGSDIGKLNASPAALDKLIERQNYRLEYWKEGDAELNYRRFFTITSLAGLRVEEENVFDDSHSLVKSWIQRGWIDGLRVDHPDGLKDPAAYLHRLHDLAPAPWIVVEKILEPGESLPQTWPVAGTTGYDFLSEVNAVFVHAKNEPALTESYSSFTGEPANYDKLVCDKKRAALNNAFVAEINRLLKLLIPIALRDPRAGKFTLEGLREATVELAACFPVYRTYGTAHKGSVTDEDRQRIDDAVKLAQTRQSKAAPEIFELLKKILLERGQGKLEDEFADRFQQLTGPAMAKGVEDCAFYCFNRFISLNEVGGNPAHFGSTVEAFHGLCATRQQDWPDSMLGTASHDTKRGEDVRARLNVLSEIPDAWSAAVQQWADLNERHHTGSCPDRNLEYFIYQTMAGAWPVSEERLLAYVEKAIREAGQHTSWREPNAAYESGVKKFISGILKEPEFIASLEKFVFSISEAGRVNSLSQTLIKLTAPGIPDIYQGCELLDFSLVDPDNRRPVDFGLRHQLLVEAKKLSAEAAWLHGNKSLAKLWLIWKILKLRTAHPDLFAGQAMYEPISVGGMKQDHVIAFMRGACLTTVAQRLPLTLQGDWADTTIFLPEGTWHNCLTGDTFHGPVVQLKQLLVKFPVALLSKELKL